MAHRNKFVTWVVVSYQLSAISFQSLETVFSAGFRVDR